MFTLRYPLWQRLLLIIGLSFFYCLGAFIAYGIVEDVIAGNWSSALWGAIGVSLFVVCIFAGQQRLNFMRHVVISNEGISGSFVTTGFSRFHIKFKEATLKWSDVESAEYVNTLRIGGSVLAEGNGYNMLKIAGESGVLLVYTKRPTFSRLIESLASHGIDPDRKST